MTGETANTGTKDQAFFAEEASRQILQRVANVLQDPDICDATFIVEEGNEKEEITAPSQLMAICSPYFKALFYPPGVSKEKKISGMQPKTFRKILDYLFRGRVPLSSIEDAWKVKVAGRTFQLKELEELCTKFLQYRIDSRNLIHFLKNTTKYDTQDLRDVVISRFLKNADKGFEDEGILDLTENELLSIMSKRPEVQARKVMDVLIKWGKKRCAALAAPKKEEPKKEAKKEEATAEEAKKDEPKKEDEIKVGEKTDETKAEDKKDEEAKKDDTKKDEIKKDEDKKDDEKTEEKKAEEKVEETKTEEKKVEEKPTAPVEPNLVLPLKPLVEFVKWDHTDASYYLKEIRGKPILSMETENLAMTQMLQAFVDNSKNVSQQSSSQAAMAAKMGPKSAQQQRGRQQGQKRDNSQECEVITERISKNSRTSQRVKTEDDIL